MTKEDGKYTLAAKEKQTPDTRTNEISVGREISIKDSEAGDLAGRKSTSAEVRGDRPEKIDVASGATIERTKLGDIVGTKQEGSPPPEPPEKG